MPNSAEVERIQYLTATKRLKPGIVAILSVIISFFWVLLAPIFSYEPNSIEIQKPPGTELATNRGLSAYEFASTRHFFR